MRTVLLQASEDLPPVPVLYKVRGPGIFAFSTAFQDFTLSSSPLACSEKTRCREDEAYPPWVIPQQRIDAVVLMGPFGREMAAQWPLVADMVKVYVKHHLGSDMLSVRHLARQAEEIRNAELQIKGLAQGRGSTSLDGVDALAAQLVRLKEAEATTRLPLVQTHGQHFLEAMLASVTHRFPEEVADEARPDPRNGPKHTSDWALDEHIERQDFTQALSRWGEGSFRVWYCQQTFDVGTMRHLLRCRDHVEHLLATEYCGSELQGEARFGGSIPDMLTWSIDRALQNSTPDWEVQLGLLAAGATSCVLADKHVPHLAEWSIIEDDWEEVVAC